MTAPDTPAANEPSSNWLQGLRVYLAAIAVGNLVWETLQLPLYTIWRTGTLREQAFAVFHCTLGDLLIALSSLTLALMDAGDPAVRLSLGTVAVAAVDRRAGRGVRTREVDGVREGQRRPAMNRFSRIAIAAIRSAALSATAVGGGRRVPPTAVFEPSLTVQG